MGVDTFAHALRVLSLLLALFACPHSRPHLIEEIGIQWGRDDACPVITAPIDEMTWYVGLPPRTLESIRYLLTFMWRIFASSTYLLALVLTQLAEPQQSRTFTVSSCSAGTIYHSST